MSQIEKLPQTRVEGARDWHYAMSIKQPEDHKITVSGFAYNSKTGEQTQRAQQTGQENLREELIRRVRERIASCCQNEERTTAAPKRERDSIGTILNSIDLVECGMTACGWSKSTAAKIASRIKTIISMLETDGGDISEERVQSVFDKLHEKAQASKRSDKTERTRQRVNVNLGMAIRLYNRLMALYPELELPVIPFPEIETVSVGQVEQVKSLPDPVRDRFARALSERVTATGLILGVALMFYCGLRNAEACALMFGKIHIVEGKNGRYDYRYAVFLLEAQIYEGELTDILKSENAYRIIIIPYVLVQMIEQRRAELKEAGYSDAEINEMPVCGEGEDPFAFIDPQRLGMFVMRLLRECGLTEEYFNDALKAMRVYPDPIDDVEAGIKTEFTAYILRRDCITRLCTLCRLEPKTVDYLVGHARDKREKLIHMSDPEIQQEVARALERYHPIPEASMSPEVNRIPVAGDQQIILAEHTIYTFEAEEAVEVELELNSLEPDSSISIAYPDGCEVDLNGRIRHFDTAKAGIPVLAMHETEVLGLADTAKNLLERQIKIKKKGSDASEGHEAQGYSEYHKE